MRKLDMLLCGVALSLAAGAAGAETLYRWTNGEGVVAFSDSLKRIPEAYRASAVKIQTSNLTSYTRYTPANPTQSGAYERELEARSARLREINAAAAADAAQFVAPATGASLGEVRVNGKLSLALPAGQAASDEPVVVEEHRVRSGGATTHVYVVKQGDKVLSVVRPHTNASDTNWMSLEEVIGAEE
jgi:hypothetical protein